MRDDRKSNAGRILHEIETSARLDRLISKTVILALLVVLAVASWFYYHPNGQNTKPQAPPEVNTNRSTKEVVPLDESSRPDSVRIEHKNENLGKHFIPNSVIPERHAKTAVSPERNSSSKADASLQEKQLWCSRVTSYKVQVDQANLAVQDADKQRRDIEFNTPHWNPLYKAKIKLAEDYLQLMREKLELSEKQLLDLKGQAYEHGARCGD